MLESLGCDGQLVNEVIEIQLQDGEAVLNRYELPPSDEGS